MFECEFNLHDFLNLLFSQEEKIMQRHNSSNKKQDKTRNKIKQDFFIFCFFKQETK